jgi:hypothetical protein
MEVGVTCWEMRMGRRACGRSHGVFWISCGFTSTMSIRGLCDTYPMVAFRGVLLTSLLPGV